MNIKTLNIYSCKQQLTIQTVQPKFLTWKYKVKLNAEAANGGVLWKSCS